MFPASKTNDMREMFRAHCPDRARSSALWARYAAMEPTHQTAFALEILEAQMAPRLRSNSPNLGIWIKGIQGGLLILSPEANDTALHPIGVR